jgi:hypothetical protein
MKPYVCLVYPRWPDLAALRSAAGCIRSRRAAKSNRIHWARDVGIRDIRSNLEYTEDDVYSLFLAPSRIVVGLNELVFTNLTSSRAGQDLERWSTHISTPGFPSDSVYRRV